MSYIKYTALFVAFAFVLDFVFKFVGLHHLINNTMLFITIIHQCASIIITNMIVKSYGRVMTFNEIVKYTLCFSFALIVINCFLMLLFFKSLMERFIVGLEQISFARAVAVVATVIIIFTISILLPMFLTNKYLEKKYKNN